MSYDDVACVELIFFLCSLVGNAELMRDRDIIELLPTLELAQKYDSEISDWLVSSMINFLFLADLAFSCLMYPDWAQRSCLDSVFFQITGNFDCTCKNANCVEKKRVHILKNLFHHLVCSIFLIMTSRGIFKPWWRCRYLPTYRPSVSEIVCMSPARIKVQKLNIFVKVALRQPCYYSRIWYNL